MPLDPASLTTSGVSASAAPVAETLDAGRINPRVVSATPVPGSNGTVYDIVLRADDSAAVTAAVAAGAVTSTTGLTNAAAATPNSPTITFLNPIQVKPSKFTLITGEPNGRDVTVSLAAGAPPPSADLAFAAAVDQPAGTPAVHLSTANPTIAAGATSAAPVKITAAAGDVAPDTRARITLTMTTADPTYDGLVVPGVALGLFSTDPTISITKNAYINVVDHSSPQAIANGAALAPSGSRLLDGQTVWFVYTVTNTSQGDWATTLTNITVTDTDTRLGVNGLIGTIDSLAPGADPYLMAVVATITAGDTTIGAG
jgi:hypothetical protein